MPPYAGPPFRMIVDKAGIHVRHELGRHADRADEPVDPHVLRDHGHQRARRADQPGQQITRQEALELYTKKNGWFLREEDDLGSIEEGKLADLVVLNKDYFAVPNDDLKKIRSVLTVVGGNINYDAGVLDTRRW